LKKLFFTFLFSLLFAICVLSYFSEEQQKILMPLRNALVVPNTVLTPHNKIKLPEGMEYKASKSGYYVNPWQASSIVSPIAEVVLNSGCDSISLDDKNKLLSYADFFSNTVEFRMSDKTKFAVWTYPIDFTYGLKPGWISGMAQGKVAVVLAASSYCTNDSSETYETLARMAILSFKVPVNKGGVSVSVKGGKWFEEYAQVGIEPPRVLNGHNYAVYSLKNLISFDKSAQSLYSSGLNAVKENIHLYNAITWSYYDNVGTPAKYFYQLLHSRQMEKFYLITGDNVFKNYGDMFSNQLLSPFSSIYRLYLMPSRFLSILLILNTVFMFALIVLCNLYLLPYFKKSKESSGLSK